MAGMYPRKLNARTDIKCRNERKVLVYISSRAYIHVKADFSLFASLFNRYVVVFLLMITKVSTTLFQNVVEKCGFNMIHFTIKYVIFV